MEFALSTHLFVNERLASHLLDSVLANGFQQIEIFAARQHFDYRDRNHVRDVAQWFSDHGMRLHSLHAPLYDDLEWGQSGGLAISVAYTERRLRIDSMEEIKRALEVADSLPFRFLILHMGLPGEDFEIEKFDAAFTSLEHLNIFAKERGVRILLENIPSPLAAPERLVQFLHYTRLELGICFDIGHAHMEGGAHPAFQTLKEHIRSTHIHDNHGEKDDHLLPFDGGIDWAAAMHDFRSADGQFPLLFELRKQSEAATATLKRLNQVSERLKDVE